MSYSFDFDSGELRRADNSVAFTVDPEIDPELFGYLATPSWLAALNGGDGTVDEQAKRVTITSLGKDWTARDDSARPEIASIVDAMVTLTGWPQQKVINFLKIMYHFVKAVKQ